eukprot:6175894-Pleurochrysis_carterae.AAC.1
MGARRRAGRASARPLCAAVPGKWPMRWRRALRARSRSPTRSDGFVTSRSQSRARLAPRRRRRALLQALARLAAVRVHPWLERLKREQAWWRRQDVLRRCLEYREYRGYRGYCGKRSKLPVASAGVRVHMQAEWLRGRRGGQSRAATRARATIDRDGQRRRRRRQKAVLLMMVRMMAVVVVVVVLMMMMVRVNGLDRSGGEGGDEGSLRRQIMHTSRGQAVKHACERACMCMCVRACVRSCVRCPIHCTPTRRLAFGARACSVTAAASARTSARSYSQICSSSEGCDGSQSCGELDSEVPISASAPSALSESSMPRESGSQYIPATWSASQTSENGGRSGADDNADCGGAGAVDS